ncbi:cutinase family protein [Nocardioides rubriscoriae]|uniref:cutinase family protein n=1 Tax=Nocardioides rubriscoriae TaxID=642762 RepID=UPI0011DFED1F|nr:cutinase family protein [Nocardioides rubriscoriae]
MSALGRGLGVLAAVVALVLGLVGCGDGSSGDETSATCVELTVIGGRGSGQAVDSARPRGFGKEAGELAVAVGDAATNPPRSWRTAYVAIDYPAVDVPTIRADPAAFDTSVQAGVDDGLAAARDAVTSCPSTRLVVIGSSQGAAVVHGIAARLAADDTLAPVRDRVLGIVLLGDPTRRRADDDVEHVDPGGVAAEDGFLADDRDDVGPALAGRVLSVCAVGDTVCASAPGTTWATLQISAVHNQGYTVELVGGVVLSWLGSRPAVG